MANTLLIHKVGTKKFWHRHNDDPLTDFAISDFYYSIDGNRFKIVEKDGARRFEYLVSNISIKDGSGAIETGFTPTTLLTRFVSLGYVPFENVVVGGLTTDEIDAIHGANSPSASNPMATIADISSAGNIDSVLTNGNQVISDTPIIYPDNGLARTVYLNGEIYIEDTVNDISISRGVQGEIFKIVSDPTKRTIDRFEIPTNSNVLTKPNETGTYATREWVNDNFTGATGLFISQDGKIVTVTNGLITSII